MTPEESAALVERFWDEVWRACNPDAIDNFVTDDFVITTAGVDVAGPEDFKAWVAAFQSTITDLKWETIETFSNVTLPRSVAVSDHWPEQRHVRTAGRWQASGSPGYIGLRVGPVMP